MAELDVAQERAAGAVVVREVVMAQVEADLAGARVHVERAAESPWAWQTLLSDAVENRGSPSRDAAVHTRELFVR